MNIAVSRTQFVPSEVLFGHDRPRSRQHLEVARHETDALVGHSLATRSDRFNDDSATTAILFGPFRLLAAKRLLLEGDEPVRIGSRALEILIALIEHHGELLSKNALMERVWPDTTVVEANLSVHIAALRRALREGSDGNRYLINMPGRGYRFVAPITLVEHREPPAQMEAATKSLQDLPNRLTPLIARGGGLQELAEQSPQWRLLIVAAATLAAEMVRGAPGVQAIAASREPFTAAQALGFSDVQSFAERVAASMGDYELKNAAVPITADA